MTETYWFYPLKFRKRKYLSQYILNKIVLFQKCFFINNFDSNMTHSKMTYNQYASKKYTIYTWNKVTYFRKFRNTKTKHGWMKKVNTLLSFKKLWTMLEYWSENFSLLSFYFLLDDSKFFVIFKNLPFPLFYNILHLNTDLWFMGVYGLYHCFCSKSLLVSRI